MNARLSAAARPSTGDVILGLEAEGAGLVITTPIKEEPPPFLPSLLFGLLFVTSPKLDVVLRNRLVDGVVLRGVLVMSLSLPVSLLTSTLMTLSAFD